MQKQTDELSLAQWLEYLEQQHTQEIQLGLTRIGRVAKKMQLLNPLAKVITVAGTNGKGSTVAALEAIYCQAGYRVGAYTSPHLLKFNERIRINTLPISDASLCAAFKKVEESRGEIPLTYFEVATLSSLWYYKEQKVDLIILEVGIGGRLDATNIIDSDLAIITTIDFDHQDYLGKTLDAIGSEKAGILRSGKPCIYADSSPPTSVVAAMENNQSPVYYLGKNYQIMVEKDDFIVEISDKKWRLPKPDIQIKTAASAVVAVNCLQNILPLSIDAQIKAMQGLKVAGRLDLRKGDRHVLYDVSHNPQSANLLAEYVKRLNWKGNVHAVFSALADKDIEGLIQPLRDCVDRWYPAQLNNKRATPQTMMRTAFNTIDLNIDQIYVDPFAAFLKAKAEAKPEDLIIVYGSFYTVAAIMEKEI